MKLKPAFRNLNRHWLNSSIIIISLAFGIACINLIILFIAREYNADGFQKNKDRIYALKADNPFNKAKKMYKVQEGAAEYIKDNFPEVEDFCRISNATPKKVIVNNQDFFDNPKVIAASSNFFSFFSYRLLSNTPEHALTTKQDVIISKELAIKYFGTSNPVGQKLTLVNRKDQNEMIISGVFKKPLESTQLNFDMVKLMGDADSHCYLLLAQNTNVKELEEKFSRNRAKIPIIYEDTPGTYYLQSLQAAYFDTSRQLTVENRRDKTDTIIALVIALMILGIALFNYLGLTNNRLTEKTKEHSIRRINGGSKTDLAGNFMLETTLLVSIAFGCSILLIIWALPFFNRLTSSSITLAYLLNLKNIIMLLGIPFLIWCASYLFAYIGIGKRVQIEALKSAKFKPTAKIHFPVFNIIQLAASIVLIIGSIIILRQIHYITHKKIGIDRNVLEVKIPRHHKNLAGIFKTQLEKHPSIDKISIAEASPVLEYYQVLLNYDDHGTEKQYTPAMFVGDQNYAKALGIKIIAGENFSENPASNQHKCIINASLAKLFPGQDLIGKGLPGYGEMIVIGIAKDFNYNSLKEFIEPAYIAYGNGGYYMMVKPTIGQEAEAREYISKTWDELIKDFPLNMESIGDRFEWMHRENTNYAKLIGACCFISVFLSMIGLFAVSIYNSRKRTKEIGIRKVNGARISEILAMLNKEFAVWVAIAFVIATPVAYYFMNKWLENFAYKAGMNWWIFALAGLLSIGIALLTVIGQSWRSATRNPVEALRYE